MWEFSKPPYKGDEHFDLGIWHPSALPPDKQNEDGYSVLQRRVDEEVNSETDEEYSEGAVHAVTAFHNEMIALVDALPEDEVCSRRWTIVIQLHPLFNLISLWPTVAVELAPAINQLAQEHGLFCYDPQSGVISYPQNSGRDA